MLVLKFVPQIQTLLIPNRCFGSILQNHESVAHVGVESCESTTIIDPPTMRGDDWFTDGARLLETLDRFCVIAAGRETLASKHKALRQVVGIFNVARVECHKFAPNGDSPRQHR